LAVQRAALASTAAYRDRAFFGRTIERLRSLLGDDSVVWKLAEGRYLLDAPPNPKNTSDAIALLQDVVGRNPNSVGGHLFLAAAKERAGDFAGATTEFAAAHFSLASLTRRFAKEPVVAYRPKKGPETDPRIAPILSRGMNFLTQWAQPGGEKPPSDDEAA